MNTIISISASIDAAGLVESLSASQTPRVGPNGRMCILVGDLFLHGTREDFAALIDGFQCVLDTLEPAPACPHCGETTGTPKDWDYGIDSETGYHDAGMGCTECVK